MGALGLQKVIDEGNAIRPSELETYRREEDLPLAEAGERSPGKFEATFDALFWRPPAKDVDRAEIELLDGNSRPLAVTLTPQANSGDVLRKFRISGAMLRPAFARLRFADGRTSAPAIIAITEALREAVREARGRKAEAAVLQLADETEEGLWLWEVLNELETAERAQNEQGPGLNRPGTTTPGGEEAVECHGQITYEQFLAGRQLRSDIHGAERHSLAGTEFLLARNFLNRILALGNDPATAGRRRTSSLEASILEMRFRTQPPHSSKAKNSRRRPVQGTLIIRTSGIAAGPRAPGRAASRSHGQSSRSMVRSRRRRKPASSALSMSSGYVHY